MARFGRGRRGLDIKRVQTKSSATHYIGEISLPNAKVRCQAETKSGGQCKMKAVNGKAVCRFHGGYAGRPKGMGKYGSYVDKNMKRKLELFYADENYMDLKDELMLLRGVLASQVEGGKIDVKNVIELTKQIGLLVEKIDKIENTRKYKLDIKVVESMMYAWLTAIRREVKDSEKLKRIKATIDATVIEDPKKLN